MAPSFFSKLLPFRNHSKNKDNANAAPAAVPRLGAGDAGDAGDATTRLRKNDRRKSLSHLIFRNSSYNKATTKRATVFIPNVLYAFPQSPPLVSMDPISSPASPVAPPQHPTPPPISPSPSPLPESLPLDIPPCEIDQAGLASNIALPESPAASTEDLLRHARSVPNNMGRMSSCGDPVLSGLLASRRRSSMLRPGSSQQPSRRPSLATISSPVAIKEPQRDARGAITGIDAEGMSLLSARRGSDPTRSAWKPSEAVNSEWRHSLATDGPTGLGFGRTAKTGPPPPPKNPSRSGLKRLYLDDGRSAADLPKYRHSIAAPPIGTKEGSKSAFSTAGKISALSGHATSLRTAPTDSTSIPPFSRSLRNSNSMKQLSTRLVRPTCSMATQTTPFFESTQPKKSISNLSATKSLPVVEIFQRPHSHLVSTFSQFDYPPSPPQSYSSFPRELLEAHRDDTATEDLHPLPVGASCELSPSIYSIQHSPKNHRSGSIFDGGSWSHRHPEIVESISSASTTQSHLTTVESLSAPETTYVTPNETTTPSPDSPPLVPKKSEVGDFPTLFYKMHNRSVESSIHSIYNDGFNAPEKEEDQPIRRPLVAGPNRVNRAERGRSHFLANAVQVARKERMRQSMIET